METYVAISGIQHFADSRPGTSGSKGLDLDGLQTRTESWESREPRDKYLRHPSRAERGIMFGILFKAKVKAEKRQAFIEFIERDIRVANEREPGTLRFDLYQDPVDENTFFVYEAYRDKKAFEEHQQNPPYQEWVSRIGPEMVDDQQPFFKDEAVCSLRPTHLGERTVKKRGSQMDEPSANARDAAMARLSEMVQDHLGIPRPGTHEHMRKLQDDLMPFFMDAARQAWMAASPVPLRSGTMPNEPSHPVYRYLHAVTESCSARIVELNSILQDVGVHDLLDDVASSPDVAMLSELPVDPYEARLLRTTGHPTPDQAVTDVLRQAASNPALLRNSEMSLENAGGACLMAHREIALILNIGPPTPAQVASPPSPTAAPGGVTSSIERPKRRKIFSGLGKLFSGLVLLSGDALVIPTLTIGSVAALPILGSLAGGIAAVGDAIGQFRREGE